MKIRKLYILVFIFIAACNIVQPTTDDLQVVVMADDDQVTVSVPQGSTVEQAVNYAGIEIGKLDRIDPTGSTTISENMSIQIIRVLEEFTVEQEVIPFERKVLQTESLPEQSTMLAQKGENGLREITYRILFENGIEVSRKPVNEGVVIQEALPEIVMVGIRMPFSPVQIPGRLVYLLAGNAWMVENTTSNRVPLVTTGDLDGRIFSLSKDGTWLLFTRRSNEEDKINSLWVARIDPETDPVLVDLKVNDIVHFADWVPGSTNQVIFSTVEARSSPPGWQANNDLVQLNFSQTGWLSKWKTLLDANSGGVYGWWGTEFAWDPAGNVLAYSRPDGIGLVDLDEGTIQALMEILPYQTRGDWAWVPGITWSANGEVIYSVIHKPESSAASPEESQAFDLAAVSLAQGLPIPLMAKTGMFSYPVSSPLLTTSSSSGDYQIVFLQAIFPDQSETSRYRIMVMDRDGSDLRELFPPQGQPGLEPQRVVWSPLPLAELGEYALAVIYQGNLWLVPLGSNSSANKAIQITGDGLVSRVVWLAGSQ